MLWDKAASSSSVFVQCLVPQGSVLLIITSSTMADILCKGLDAPFPISPANPAVAQGLLVICRNSLQLPLGFVLTLPTEQEK